MKNVVNSEDAEPILETKPIIGIPIITVAADVIIVIVNREATIFKKFF